MKVFVLWVSLGCLLLCGITVSGGPPEGVPAVMRFNDAAAFFLITFGFYTVITKHDLIKAVTGFLIAECGAELLILSAGYVPGGTDHVPQAFALISIVLSSGCAAVGMVLAGKLYESCGTLDTREIGRLRG